MPSVWEEAYGYANAEPEKEANKANPISYGALRIVTRLATFPRALK